MRNVRLALTTRTTTIAVVAAVAALSLTACSGGNPGGSTSGGGGDQAVDITYLTWRSDVETKAAQALADAFHEENPNITVTIDTYPEGTDGDNVIKTRLATGEMDDVFFYNSGSLLQALNPDQFLVDLSDQPWVADLTDDMKTAVSTDKGVYGTPGNTAQVGAMMYNKKVYEDLGLKVPTTWDEFIANCEKIKAAGGVAPVIETFAETWTSQIIMLGAFGDVLHQDPDWATEYTANNRKFAQDPGLWTFDIIQQLHDKGYLNEDFASAQYDEGVRKLATGEGAHWPILTQVLRNIAQNYPDQIDDIGVFAIPAPKADDTTLTVWLPNAAYIPRTTEGAKLDAAKKFLAFMSSDAGCAIQNETKEPTGPYATTACKVPDDAPPAFADMQAYFDDGRTAPALEFLSPIKGPSLEQITVEVGSGIRSAADGAQLYDEDVKKQAQQLGVAGW